MAHRPILNDKQRNTLLGLPTREHELLQYYVLSNVNGNAKVPLSGS